MEQKSRTNFGCCCLTCHKKCDLFDKFEASDFKDVAKCIDAGFLAGNAAEFWILTLKQEQAESSFLTGAKRLLKSLQTNVSNPNLRICCPPFQKLEAPMPTS